MRRIAVVPFALLLSAGAAAAQAPPARDPAAAASRVDTAAVTLRGIVRDTAGRPLVGAQVMTAEATTITEADGRFELRDLRADTLHLVIRRIGYRPASITLAPDRGLIVEFAATLVPAAVELGTIVIEGRTLDRRLWTEGFYDRAKVGFGTHLGPEDIGRFTSLESVLRTVPNVRVQRTPDGRAIAFGRSSIGVCPLVVHVDGVLVRFATEVGLDALVPPGEVHAVEVYARASQVPTMLRTVAPAMGVGTGLPSPSLPGAGPGPANAGPVDCGAVAVWTKPYGADG